MSSGPVAGLLLAAGGGTRFGGPKALVRFDGELLVERGARVLRAAGLHPVVVVLGAAADTVRAQARLDGVQVVVNPGWELGLGSSLRAGLAALGDSPAVVVALADQPHVTPQLIGRLVDAWTGGAAVAVAAYHGQGRNPVLLDASTWPGVAERAVGDVGARGYLREHPELVRAVACEDLGSESDIDTPADLTRLQQG